jgi:hypothetical protein
MKYPILLLAAAMTIAAAPTPDPTAPPSPPPLNAVPTATPASDASPAAATSGAPTPTPSPDLDTIFGTKHGKHDAKDSKSGSPPPPPVDTRKGLDGVWEIQIQRGAKVEYEHMNLKQTDKEITGTFLTKDNKKFPVAGSIDGQQIRLVVSLADGSTILLEARVDGTTDMLGMFTDAAERVPFTAAYRAKEKWIDNINAQPAGLGSP